MTVPAPRRNNRSIADLLEGLPRTLPTGAIHLRQLLDALGDRSMASALLLLTVPQVLPIPLLISNLLALPIVAVAVQIMLGQRSLWLPNWLLDKPVGRERLEQICEKVVPPLRRVERLIRPRYANIWARDGGRLLGLACIAIALVSVAPLPFTGWVPGWALLLIALGLLQHDGLVVFVGLAIGTVAVAIFVAVVVGLVSVGDWVI